MNQLRSRLKWRFYFAKARVGLHFRRTMVEGVLLSVPIVITFMVLRWVWGFVDGVLRPTIESSAGISFPGLGVAALLVLIYPRGSDLGDRPWQANSRVGSAHPDVAADRQYYLCTGEAANPVVFRVRSVRIQASGGHRVPAGGDLDARIPDVNNHRQR